MDYVKTLQTSVYGRAVKRIIMYILFFSYLCMPMCMPIIIIICVGILHI